MVTVSDFCSEFHYKNKFILPLLLCLPSPACQRNELLLPLDCDPFQMLPKIQVTFVGSAGEREGKTLTLNSDLPS